VKDPKTTIDFGATHDALKNVIKIKVRTSNGDNGALQEVYAKPSNLTEIVENIGKIYDVLLNW
jgi:hypothetical protein